MILSRHIPSRQQTASSRQRFHKVDRLLLLAVVFLLILPLAGCHSTPSPETVTRILTALAGSAAFEAQRRRAGAEFIHFARRRISWLIGENSSWDSAPDYTLLRTRMGNEINAIESFLGGLLKSPETPGPLGGATDSGIPPHTDLQDVAKIFVDDAPDLIEDRKTKLILARRQRVRRIVWRAAAIHQELWEDSSTMAASLKIVPLTELLNRRLRFVERMLFCDNAQSPSRLRWSIASGAGPWKDSQRTAMFEYPFIGLNKDRSDPFSIAVAAAGLSLSTMNPDWQVQAPPKSEIRYFKRGRIRPPAAANWELSDYKWTMKLNGKTPAQVFDLLVPSAAPVSQDFEDFWQRNWLFCDHMAAALEVDALRFGLFRRTGSENEFNNAADDGVTLHVPIPFTGEPDPRDVMDKGKDYFEGAAIDDPDLQIGDWVIIWNNYFMRVVLRTDFGLENSIIADIVSDDPRDARLVGHGASESAYADFVEGLLGALANLMKSLRTHITTKVQTQDPSHNYLVGGASLPLSHMPATLVFWAPFGEQLDPADVSQELAVPGAWWIRVRLADAHEQDDPPLKLDDALVLFPKSVAIDLSIHTPPPSLPNHDPDYKESIYIPLSQPDQIRGGWAAYFKRVKDGSPPPISTKLIDAKVDKDWAPGFHHNGPNTKIPVLRPKVRT